MANTTLTGRFFEETPVVLGGSVVRYFGIHRSTSGQITVSNTRKAEGEYYNFNLGDPDWLGQDRPFLTGEEVLIVAWDNETQGVHDIGLQRFSFYKFTHTGLDTYITDIQLLPKQPMTCAYTLVPSSIIVGQSLSIYPSQNETVTWEFNTKTMSQADSYYSVQLFNITTTNNVYEYSFDDGLTWQSTQSKIIDAPGIYTTRIRFTDGWGSTQECGGKTVRSTFQPPVPCISFTPDSPIVGEPITVTSCTLDPQQTITGIVHEFNGTIIDSNLIKDYVYTSSIDSFQSTVVIRQTVTWFDGIETKTSVVTETIVLSNQPPVGLHTQVDETDDRYSFTPTYTDPDGTVDAVRWKILYKLPFKDSYTEVLDTGNGPLDPVQFTFPQCGFYRVTSIAMDNLGGTGSYTTDLEIPCVSECPECPEPPECPECPQCPDIPPHPTCPPQEIKYIYITDNVITVEMVDEDVPEVSMEETKEAEVQIITIEVEADITIDFSPIEIVFDAIETEIGQCTDTITIEKCS